MKVDLPLVATLILVIVGVACQAAAIVSAAGVSAASSIAVYVAGGVCIVTSPWVAVKQYRIAKNRGKFVQAPDSRVYYHMCAAFVDCIISP